MAEAFTIKELRGKSRDQLGKILSERQEKLRHLRFQVHAREVKNHRELRHLRREIARVHTVLRQTPATASQS